MNESVSEEMLPHLDLDVDADALRLLEEDFTANQSMRSVKSPLQLFIEDLSNKLFRNAITTISVFMVMLTCTGVIIWNGIFRMPNPIDLQSLEAELSENHELKLSLVKQLENIDQTDLAEKLEVESFRVFYGYPSLAIWIDQVVKKAQSLSIRIAYRIGNPHSSPIEDVLEVPVYLIFSSSSVESVFSNAMKLISDLLSDQWHLDIVSTKAIGDSEGLKEMEVAIHVWVRDTRTFTSETVDTRLSNGDSQSDDYEEDIQ